MIAGIRSRGRRLPLANSEKRNGSAAFLLGSVGNYDTRSTNVDAWAKLRRTFRGIGSMRANESKAEFRQSGATRSMPVRWGLKCSGGALGLVLCLLTGARGAPPVAAEFDRLLAAENAGYAGSVAAPIDDLGLLRRLTVDLVGRIPTEEEIRDYLRQPAAERREAAVERLLRDERFADRWTVFFGDMLRIRSYTDGGAQLNAFVHQAIEEDMPYDVLCRQLLAANGRAGSTPEVGFILGDNADPMALAGATSQVFLGIRIACAQCHDHPFDVWTREQFYGLAAYFGKTQRIESQLTRAVYTTEIDQSTVLWPPADEAEGVERLPMQPTFPFALAAAEEVALQMARLAEARAPQPTADEGPSVDDLLAEAGERAEKRTDGEEPEAFDVASEAKREAAELRVHDDLYRASQLRRELAEYVTSPRNRYFSQAFVNRAWKELVGRGFVEPVDDFSRENPPSHPQALAYLADEFVAGGFDLRSLVRNIVGSEAYRRGRLADIDEATRLEAEAAFASAPVRRMIAETLFDSVVQAGHLYDVKHPAGANVRTIRELVRIPLESVADGLAGIESDDEDNRAEMAAVQAAIAQAGGYDLESAIEVDFDEVLAAQSEEVTIDEMEMMSDEELEAMQMTDEAMTRTRYIERWIETSIDDNPKFASALRMAAPADPAHFLRVFGQPSRESLGEHRDDSSSMRQALMMLNGKLTNEAARVGDFEPMHALLVGEKADVSAAVRLAYREILTREPTAEELSEAREIVEEGPDPRDGMADLRWVLFNCNEFRYIP